MEKNMIKMVAKMNLIIGVFLVLIVLSCSGKSIYSEKNVKTVSFFSLSEKYLPNFLDSSYTLIYRIGSIQWSPYITVLALKSDGEKPKYNLAFLWQFNFSIEGKRSFMYEKNYMKSFIIHLKKGNIKDIEGLKLNIHDSIINNYNFNGEGRCNNIYIIRKFGKSECLIIDKNSNEQNKSLIREIFTGISAQEHFQLFALDKNCNQLDSLANLILKTGHIDPKPTYQIDYEEIKPAKKPL
jgi:hypothetical protein